MTESAVAGEKSNKGVGYMDSVGHPPWVIPAWVQRRNMPCPVDAGVSCRWIASAASCDQRVRLVLQEMVGSSSNDERP